MVEAVTLLAGGAVCALVAGLVVAGVVEWRARRAARRLTT